MSVTTLAALEALPIAERNRLLTAVDVVVARHAGDPSREHLIHGRERLEFILHLDQPMDAAVLRVDCDLDGDESERLTAMVLVAHAARVADEDGDDPEG